jgi:hypothetical protein
MTSNLASPFFTAINANLSPHVVDLNALIADIVNGYCELGSCVKRIKYRPESRTPKNIARVDALDHRVCKAFWSYL